jgi:hypothetical protein
MIDRLWRLWQLHHPNPAFPPGLLPTALPPFAMTVADTLDIKLLGYDAVHRSGVGQERRARSFADPPSRLAARRDHDSLGAHGGRGYHRSVAGEHSIHRVRVRTPSHMVALPWDSAQAFQARCIAAYPTVHRVVEHFRAVGTSRSVDLLDPNDRTFALAVIEAWAAQVGEKELPPGIRELGDALRDDAT